MAELIIFKPKTKILELKVRIKLNGKKSHPTVSVKYLGVKTKPGKCYALQSKRFCRCKYPYINISRII